MATRAAANSFIFPFLFLSFLIFFDKNTEIFEEKKERKLTKSPHPAHILPLGAPPETMFF